MTAADYHGAMSEARVRAIRGAVCLERDDAAEMRDAVCELLDAILSGNNLAREDIISVILTSTPDLRSSFPAEGARAFGLTDVPLLCAQEIDVAGAMPRVIRVMLHGYSTRAVGQISHVYLRGAEALRQDLIT